MAYDTNDTIVAVASAPGGAARGVVRLSGGQTLACLERAFTPDAAEPSIADSAAARRIAGSMRLSGDGDEPPMTVPGALLVWPAPRSYTRQPAAEFHCIGSPPLLAGIVEEMSRHGARPAAPGEFTLRAFLAGRIDLTQSEAVLSVIDARGREELDAALDQLAGGLSRPLHRLRNDLLAVLAELEAGLDFAEEDIEFISRGAVLERLVAARAAVAATLAQMAARDRRGEVPRVVLVGPPNAGKSRLFNALVARYGGPTPPSAIVSSQAGATRDYLVGRVTIDGVECELIDTAGEVAAAVDTILQAAQENTAAQRRTADVRLVCLDAVATNAQQVREALSTLGAADVAVLTKSDLAAPVDREATQQGFDALQACSAATGDRIADLAQEIRVRVTHAVHEGTGAVAAATAARCSGSLREAERAVSSAIALVDGGAEELISAELRSALDALGEVVGAVCTDDVLDRVFSQFCIGK